MYNFSLFCLFCWSSFCSWPHCSLQCNHFLHYFHIFHNLQIEFCGRISTTGTWVIVVTPLSFSLSVTAKYNPTYFLVLSFLKSFPFFSVSLFFFYILQIWFSQNLWVIYSYYSPSSDEDSSFASLSSLLLLSPCGLCREHKWKPDKFQCYWTTSGHQKKENNSLTLLDTLLLKYHQFDSDQNKAYLNFLYMCLKVETEKCWVNFS